MKSYLEGRIDLNSWLGRYAHALILGLAACVLLFVNLANQFPQVDEANTMAISENVLKFGYPVIWDGQHLVSPYFDGDLTEGLVWISHPWLQFYVAAGSFGLFGLTTFAARLPFALAGLFSVVAVFFLARRMSGSSGLAWLTAWLLILHPGFLLAARQSRYHSLTFLFSILTLLTFLNWLSKPKKLNWLWFVLSSALLFHTYYPYWVFMTVGLGLYFVLAERRWKLLPAFAGAGAAIALLVLPWYLWASPQPPADSGPQLSTWGRHFLIYLWKIHTWVAPLLTLSLIWGGLALLSRLGWLNKEETKGLAPAKSYLVFLFILLYTAFISIIPILTTQYVSPAIPFLTVLAAYLLWKIREHKGWIFATVLALYLTTNLWHAFPYIVAEKSGLPPKTLEAVIPNARCNFIIGPSLEHYLKDQLVIQSDLFEFLTSLVSDYDNRIEGVVRTLQEQAEPGDTVYTSWVDANAVRFYTRLNVVYSFFPRFKNPEVKALVNRPGVTVDWVVPDTLRFYPSPEPYYRIDMSRYEKVAVPYPKTYFDNTSNLDEAFHLTDRTVPQSFFLLKRKEDGGVSPAAGAAATGSQP